MDRPASSTSRSDPGGAGAEGEEPRDTLRRAAGLLRDGRAAEAEALAAPLAAARRDDADALHVLGVAVHLQRRPGEALDHLARAAELRPGDATLWNSLGNAHRLAGDEARAEECFRHSLQLDPGDGATWYNLGALLQRRGEPAAAVEPLRRAVAGLPESYDAALALGTALFRAGGTAPGAAGAKPGAIDTTSAGDDAAREGATARATPEAAEAALAVAEEWFRAAHRLAPRRAGPWNNLAAVLVARGDTEAALEAFRRALEAEPDDPWSRANLGAFHGSQGRVGEAAEAYRAARTLSPGSSPVRLNLALTLLQGGYFEEAWGEYEARFAYTGSDVDPAWDAPRWDGSPLGDGELDGQALLITEEQGYGDMIQFARYATLVRRAGGEPWIEARAPVAALLATVPGVAGIVPSRHDPGPRHTEPGRFAAQVPALSLPGVFATELATIPAEVPYVSPAPRLAPRAAELLAAGGGELRVGLVWAGSRAHPGDAARSCPLAALAPLAAVPGVRLFNLLHGERGREAEGHPGLGLVDLTPHLGDFHHAAAVVRALDLVITVDTSMAHLAGALGHPVWTLLAHVPDWRWLLERDDSPWYPSMRLFRQRRAGDWEELVERVAAALAARAAARAGRDRG